MRQAVIRVAMIGLATRLVWMYILPAWNHTPTDFQNYYTAAWALRQGDPLIDLYDPSWFQRQSEQAGFQGQSAMFNYFTPVSALIMWPLAHLPPLEAKRLWVVLNVAALVISVILIARFLRAPPAMVMLVALLGGDALGNNFLFGQFYIILTLLLAVAIGCLERRPAIAACCLAFAAAVKVFPAVFIAAFAFLKRWKVAAWAMAGGVVLLLLGLALVGWIPHRVYLEEVLSRTARGEVQDPYNVGWNTLQALLRRMLVAEPGLNPDPVADLPAVYFFLRTFVAIGVVMITFMALRRRSTFGFIEYGAMIAAISLITPSQASYHQVLFFPAIAAAIHVQQNRRLQWVIAVMFALICSNYMGAFAEFDSGLAMLVAFPRVYLVIGLWAMFLCTPEGCKESSCYHVPGVAPRAASYPRLPSLHRSAVIIGLIALGSAIVEWQRWKADTLDRATMARPEAGGFVEIDPTVGSAGLVFSSLTDKGFDISHPSAYGSGLVYESGGAVYGQLPDGTGLRWPGAIEPALGPSSVVALSENGRIMLERTRNDPEWREIFTRSSMMHDPAVSPDGTSVAFSEWVNGRYRISEWKRSAGEVRTLLEGNADFRYPTYSPDAAELAFATNAPGNWDIGRYLFSTRRYSIMTTSRSNDFMPVFSPDGAQIYFASDRRRGYRFSAIYTIALVP